MMRVFALKLHGQLGSDAADRIPTADRLTKAGAAPVTLWRSPKKIVRSNKFFATRAGPIPINRGRLDSIQATVLCV
jgi:hypothetical protein